MVQGLSSHGETQARDANMTTTDDLSDTVHYSPGDRPLCGAESHFAIYSSEVDQVQGCEDYLELVAEDREDQEEHGGRCLHCRQEIRATGGVEWRRVVRAPCPHCGKAGW